MSDPLAARLEPGRASRRGSLKAAELIAQDLATYIVENRLPEGTRLPTEAQMRERFGVGRTTLREGLRLLETRGVLSIRPGRYGGSIVRRPRPVDLAEALTLLLQFERATLSDVLWARIAIEPSVAGLAAANATPEHVQALEASINVMRAHLQDSDVFLQQNQAFHSVVAQASHNSILQMLVESLRSIADGAVLSEVQYPPKRRQAVAEAHSNIAEAIAAHDPATASAAMHHHLTDAGRYWKATYGQAFSSTVTWYL